MNTEEKEVRETEYGNCKLGGSKIPAQKRLDIERSLRVKDAVDVLDTLEDAYYNKVKFIDGIVPPASYAAFIDAIPNIFQRLTSAT